MAGSHSHSSHFKWERHLAAIDSLFSNLSIELEARVYKTVLIKFVDLVNRLFSQQLIDFSLDFRAGFALLPLLPVIDGLPFGDDHAFAGLIQALKGFAGTDWLVS